MQFCFESSDWFSVFPKENHIQLKKIFRQQDLSYAKALNQIREGRISRKTIELLGGRVGLSKLTDMTPTQMMPTRSKVDAINVHNMALLTGEEHVYEMKTVLDLPVKMPILRKITKDEIEIELKYIQGGLLCERSLMLKVGSQVMCIVNMKHNEFGEDLSLCNGSQGIVTGFSSMGSPIVKFTNGLESVITPHVWASENIPTIGLSQIPLILAWAITIHKAQGTTMDCAEIDAGNDIFECGQTYVALSRVKSIEGLYLRSFDIEKITVNRKVKEFYTGLL
jgi:ATP-dependent DNA helicase PIF1